VLATVDAGPWVVLDEGGWVAPDAVVDDDELSAVHAARVIKNAPMRTWRDFTPAGYRAAIGIRLVTRDTLGQVDWRLAHEPQTTISR
jgi:hypothetical protein